MVRARSGARARPVEARRGANAIARVLASPRLTPVPRPARPTLPRRRGYYPKYLQQERDMKATGVAALEMSGDVGRP